MRIPNEFDYSPVYYLAGPMSGYEEYNYPAFERTYQALLADGIKVESPHKIPWPEQTLDGDELWQTMMRKAITMLLGCTGIILMRGWIDSRGALTEYNIAVALNMPVYFLDGKFLVAMHDPDRKAVKP